jgi:hypothetical protein
MGYEALSQWDAHTTGELSIRKSSGKFPSHDFIFQYHFSAL